MGISPKSPNDNFCLLLGCSGGVTDTVEGIPSTAPSPLWSPSMWQALHIALPLLPAHIPPPFRSHNNPNLIVWVFPTTTLMWLSECSSSARSALEVTGDKAPATAKGQALLQLQPQHHPPFLFPWLWKQPKWQSPGCSTPPLPFFLCSHLLHLQGFPPWHQLGRRIGEQVGEGRQDNRDAIKVENLGKPWEQECVGKGGCKMQGRQWPLNGSCRERRSQLAAHGEI